MKHLILFFLLTIASFGQVTTVVDSLTASDTTSHFFTKPYSQATLTITLSSANDTVLVYVGTNETSPKYGRVAVTDGYTGGAVGLITGNTTANRKYILAYANKSKYIRLESTSNGATVLYTLEAY